DTNTKVPGLGDIPLLGGLFKVRNGTRSKTDLYIVVTPTIIKRGDLGLASASASTLQAHDEATIAPTAFAPPAQQAAAPTPLAPADPAPPIAAATSADRAASPAVATPPALTQAPAPAPPHVRRAASGPVSVQIGAFAAADMAQRALSETADALPDQLAGKSRKVEAASKDGRAFYRASIGGFASKADAAAFCQAMKGLGKACFVSNRRERAGLRDLDMRPAISARSS
ncbi:MAG TPA: SPOR domain-containing protein, partial [Caulobacteraceae bacterium]|nr:SPOR domain-containing protein [Caulobacteraceae bacterium]